MYNDVKDRSRLFDKDQEKDNLLVMFHNLRHLICVGEFFGDICKIHTAVLLV